MKHKITTLILALALLTFAIPAHAQPSKATKIYRMGSTATDTIRMAGTKHQPLYVGSLCDGSISFVYTNHSTDSVIGSARLMASNDGTNYFNYPGFENDTVILNRASINKGWIIEHIHYPYVSVYMRANSYTTNTGYGTANTQLNQQFYP